jgi:hypothetical protein
MIATYAWLAGGEIPSQRLRSYTFGLAAAVGFFGAWLTTFTAPYFINPASLNWGPKSVNCCLVLRSHTDLVQIRIYLVSLVSDCCIMGLLLLTRSQG